MSHDIPTEVRDRSGERLDVAGFHDEKTGRHYILLGTPGDQVRELDLVSACALALGLMHAVTDAICEGGGSDA